MPPYSQAPPVSVSQGPQAVPVNIRVLLEERFDSVTIRGSKRSERVRVQVKSQGLELWDADEQRRLEVGSGFRFEPAEGRILQLNGRSYRNVLDVFINPVGRPVAVNELQVEEYLRSVIHLLKERVRRLPDFVSLGAYFFTFEYRYDPAAEKKTFTAETGGLLAEMARRFEDLPEFTQETAEHALNSLAEDNGLKRARLIHPVRLAVSGVPGGPGLFEMLALLTKPVVVERIEKAVEYIKETRA